MDPGLLSLLESLTGPQKIAYGDPFWNELLASPVLLEAVARDAASDNPIMLHFGQRMVSSNLRSGNLAHLLQHTIQCIRLSLAQRAGPADGPPDFFVLEALNCMCISTALIGQVFALAGSDPEAVMEHLQPFSYDSQDATRAVAQTPTEGAVEGGGGGSSSSRAARALHVSARPLWADGPQALVPALTEAVCSWVLAEGLEADHKLEAVNLLIVLLSSQLYHQRPSGVMVLPDGGTTTALNPFLEALMREAADQNEKAAVEHQGDTSKGLGYRMVRTLLMWFATQPRVLKGRHPDTAMSLSSITPRWLGGTGRGDATTSPGQQPGAGSSGGHHGSSGSVTSSPLSTSSMSTTSSPRSTGGLLGAITLPFRTIYSLIFSSAMATSTASISAAHSLASASLPSPPRSHRSPSRRRSGSFSSSLSSSQAAAAAYPHQSGTKGGVLQSSSLLADRASMLLLLLVQNHRSRGEVNPFRDAFCSIIDERYDDYVDDSEMLGQYGGHSLKMPFDKLYASFAANLHTEQAALLFYSLIIGNPIFLDTTLSRGDVEMLFLPLLQQMYHIDHIRSDRQLYVLIIVLLILTQDAAFNMGIFRRIMIANVPWYKERHLTNISLGSLIILCVLRVMVYNLNKARDMYLLSNCSAILLNLAAQAEHIHEYTAVRMTNVLHTLMRRFLSLQQQQQAAAPSSSPEPRRPPAPTTPSRPLSSSHHHHHLHSSPPRAPAAAATVAGKPSPSFPPHHPPPPPQADYFYDPGVMSSGVIDTVLENSNSRSPMRANSTAAGPTQAALQDGATSSSNNNNNNQAELLSEAMRVLLTVFNVCLRPSSLQHNLRVIHYLLYSKRELDPYLHNPRIVELGWLGNLPSTLEHFNRLVDEEEQTLSVEKAMDILEKGARTLVGKMRSASITSSSHPHTTGGGDGGGGLESDVKFTYEEADDPEEFFVPYIWEVVLNQTSGDLFWLPDKVLLCQVGDKTVGGDNAEAAAGARAGDGGRSASIGGEEEGGGLLVKGAVTREGGAGHKQVVLTMNV